MIEKICINGALAIVIEAENTLIPSDYGF